jgi:hypothetical protein
MDLLKLHFEFPLSGYPEDILILNPLLQHYENKLLFPFQNG